MKLPVTSVGDAAEDSDVDYEKLLQEKLEIESTLQTILTYLPGHVYWQNKEGVILGCNENQAISLGYKNYRDVIGKHPNELLSKEEADALMYVLNQVIESGKPLVLEEKTNYKQGARELLSYKVPLLDEKGDAKGIMGISIDITAQKEAERREKLALLETLEAKAIAKAEKELRQIIHVLSGSIVHDIRTPITTLNITSAILKDILDKLLTFYKQNQKNKKIESFLRLSSNDLLWVESAADQLKSIAEQMSHFIDVTLKSMSKGLTGEFKKNDLVKCSIEQCINKTMNSFPFASGERELVHYQVKKDFTFLGDEILIMRVLLNLIKNSIEQIQNKGKGEIFLSIEEDDDYNFLCIKDTAGGVNQEIIDNLFSPYQSQKEKGTGVGLAFCKIAMQSLGGDITSYLVDGDCIEFRLGFLKV